MAGLGLNGLLYNGKDRPIFFNTLCDVIAMAISRSIARVLFKSSFVFEIDP